MFIRSTPGAVAFPVELYFEDWEWAYGSWPNEKLRTAIVMTVTNEVANIISCFKLQNCIKLYILLNYLCLSQADISS